MAVHRYNPGDTVTLSVALIDEATPANNPIDGETVQVAIRRGSDDRWWDFVASAWDNLTYATLEASNWGTHADKGDGSYETDWDQSSADSSAVRTYFVIHKVTTGSGDFDGRVNFDKLVFDYADAIPVSGSGDNVVNITVSDGTDPVPGARVYIKNTETGDYQYGADANTNGVATFQLDDGTYWVKVNADGYAHSAEQITVDENPEAITITVTGIALPAAGSNPACLRVYTYIRDDDNGDLLGEDEGFMKVVHYEIPAFVDGDLIAPYSDAQGDTDATGLAYLDLIRGSTYTLRVGTDNFSREFTGVVPSAATYAGSTIALATLVGSTYGWDQT